MRVDFRVTKGFKIGPKIRISAFWEMFNAFNAVNYNGVNSLVDDPSTFGLYNSAADMRRARACRSPAARRCSA